MAFRQNRMNAGWRSCLTLAYTRPTVFLKALIRLRTAEATYVLEVFFHVGFWFVIL